jgi:opacity protein-like surface antigen
MRLKRLLLASSALALFAGAGTAQADGLYISVFGGANWAEDSSASFFTRVDTDDATGYNWSTDPDTGFVVGGVVGTHLDKWVQGLRVELEASYRRNDVGGVWNASDFDTGPTVDFTTGGAIDANLSTFAVMANVWYEHDMGWKVRPYVGGGVGWARTKLDGVLLTTTTFDTTFDRENDGFAWQLGVGFNYEAAPGVDVGLGYRYFNGPDINEPFGIDPFFAGKQFFGKVDNDNHSVMLNLTIDVN